MADGRLVYGIKFDLEKAVEEASKDWDKYAKKLEKALEKHPVKVKIGFDLDKKLDTLDDVKKKLSELKIEPITPENKTALRELIRELKELAKIMEKVSSLKGIELPELQAAKAAKMRKEVEQADAKLAMQQERTRQAQERLTLAQKRAEMQAHRTSQAYHDQDGYISRLLKRMAVYAAYSGVNTFLTSVREVTAQFELQRISLGAIIQDQQKANQIFAEIKAFALTSPLKILDLTKYTKQMAAYGFAADQVFDVTKRLADISVGLGVDMGRLSLAVSQIRAATVLKSSELRQLTETGLPMLDLLAKKLTETQGKIVTTADVMDLISKRAISYEMVEEILYDLTDAGGMFYNMQVKQSQTLFGMWSKLGDAAAIMYDQIGNTQGVNEGMKTLIHSLELLMRNWKTTARVIDVAVGSMIVYAVGLKNAAISTNALSGATTLLNLAHKQQVIQTPKIVAAIIGQNKATKLSTTLTSLHTKAVLRHAVATNVLTKGFWKLTAAMLANPWVAAAAAITAVGLALFHFIGNTETAAERMEALNNSVASLKNLDDTITPMIDTYNELINKTERTAEEEKKLSEITHELAKRYPGAVKSIGDFGEEIDLVSDKLNALYQAEKQARMDSVVYEFGKTEQKIKDTEAEIEKLQQQLASGTKTDISQVNGARILRTVALTDEDKYNIIKQIDELRYGTDGQGGLIGLRQAAEAAEAAMKGMTVDELQIQKFGAWKKTLSEFRQQVGDVRVSLFDDSTINQFGSLEEALKKTAEKYKDNIALVKTYDDVLKSAFLTAEERAKIEGERAEADAMATLAKKALDYYNTLSTAFDKSKGSKSDPRLQTLQEIANKMAEVNKEYDELLKKEGQTKALADTQRLFASSFEQMKKTADKYGFKLPTFEVPQTIEDVQKWYKAIQKEIQRLGLKNADKVLIELGFKSDKAAIDKQQKDIEKQLKELADRISRTKTAKEFYEKILKSTRDVNLAENMTLSVFGIDGSGLAKQTADQVRTLAEGIGKDIPKGIINLDETINPTKLREWADELAKIEGATEVAEKLKKIADDEEKVDSNRHERWAKDLEKAKEYADKRIELAQYTADQIAEIEAKQRMLDPNDANYKAQMAAYDEMIRGYREREKNEAAKLDYEQVKEQIGMFDDLGVRIGTAFESILADLKAYTQSPDFARLGLEAQKNVYSQIAKIEDRMAEGFQGIGIGTVSEYVREYSTAASEYLTAQRQLKEATLAAIDADNKYNEAKKNGNQATIDAALAEKQLADSRVAAATAAVNTTGANLQRTQSNAARASEKFNSNLQKVESSLQSLNNGALKALWDLIGDKGKRSVGEFLSGSYKMVNAIDKLTKALADSGSDMGKLSKSIVENLATALSSIDPEDSEAIAKAATESLKQTLSSVINDKGVVELLSNTLSKNIGEIASQALSGVLSTEDAVNKVGALIDGIADAASSTGEMWGAIISLVLSLLDEFAENGIGTFLGELLDKVGEAVEGILANLLTESIPKILGSVGNIVKGVGTGLGDLLTFGIFDLTGQKRVKKANKEIERQQELLDQLEYTYGRLEKAAEKAFGGDYINNFKQQQKNLQAQAIAYQKQAAAERSKGKKADKDKIKEYEEAYRDTMDEIADMQGQIAEQMLGTDLTSAARDFAKAWLDAYKEFGNTADAMSEKFHEMIENMVVEGALSKVMERALEPMFKMIDEMGDQDFFSESFWKNVVAKAEQGAKDADYGAQTMMKFLEQAGISVRDLGGEMTGISRDIATASEESINGLAQGVNTQNFYISQIHADVAMIRQVVTGGYIVQQPVENNVDTTALWNQHLQLQQGIYEHTRRSAEKCEAMAIKCSQIAEDIHKVIVPIGVSRASASLYVTLK